MRKHRAFTLIEVLIVVYIIALLLVVVRPGLMLAGEQAKRAVCAVNLHHIGQALDKYAQDNTGLIPPQWLGHKDGTAANGPLEDYERYFANNDTSLQFSAYYPGYAGNPPLQLAKLYAGGYITQPLSVFYCPGKTVGWAGGSFAASSYDQPGKPWEQSWYYNRVRYGYSFYTHGMNKLDLLKQEPVVFDRVHSWQALPHAIMDKPTGLNALFGDGHVKFDQNPAIFADELWDGPAHLYSPAQIGTWYQIVDRITP